MQNKKLTKEEISDRKFLRDLFASFPETKEEFEVWNKARLAEYELEKGKKD